MPVYKLVFRFKFAGKGWTEVFYRNSSTAGDAVILGPTFIPESLACRNPGVILQSLTASNVALPRDTKIVKFNAVAPGIAGATPDVTNTAVRLQLNAAASGGRKLWLRGLNDTWTVRDAAGNTALAAALITRVNNFIVEIVAHQFQIQVIDKVNVNPWIPATTVSQHLVSGKAYMKIQCWPGFAIVAGDDVYLSGFPQQALGGAKGVFRVIETTADSIVVNYSWILGATTFPLVGAQVRKATYGYFNITDGGVDDLSSHDTGAPTDRPRGRRRGLIVRR